MDVRIDSNGATIGCIAAKHNATAVMEFLLERTKKLGSTFQKETPLHYAAHFKQPQMVEYLLNQNIYSVDVQDLNGETPLLAAITVNDQKSVEVLLDAGAEVNLSDNKLTTPLMRGAAYGHYDICQLVIQR